MAAAFAAGSAFASASAESAEAGMASQDSPPVNSAMEAAKRARIMAIYNETMVPPEMPPMPTTIKEMKAQNWVRDPQRPDSWQPPDGYHGKRRAKHRWKQAQLYVTKLVIIWYWQRSVWVAKKSERIWDRWMMVRHNVIAYHTARYWWRLAQQAGTRRRARQRWKMLKGRLAYASSTRKSAQRLAAVKARHRWKMLRLAIKSGWILDKWKAKRRWNIVRHHHLREYIVHYWCNIAKVTRRRLEGEARLSTLRKWGNTRPTLDEEEQAEVDAEMVRLREMLGLSSGTVGSGGADGTGEDGWNGAPLIPPPHSLRGLHPLEGLSLREPWGTDVVTRAAREGVMPSANYATSCLRDRLTDGIGESIADRRRHRMANDSQGSSAATRPFWDGSPYRYIPSGLDGIKPMTAEPWAKDMVLHPFGQTGARGGKVKPPPRDLPWARKKSEPWVARELHAQIARAYKNEPPRGRPVRAPNSARDTHPGGARSTPGLRWPVRPTRSFSVSPTKDYAPSPNGARRNWFNSVAPTPAWRSAGGSAPTSPAAVVQTRFRLATPAPNQQLSPTPRSASSLQLRTPRSASSQQLRTPRSASSLQLRTPRGSRRRARSAAVTL